ncbi:uncharacterized protein LOC106653308 [Trichogramma pretiosum]|uniref:uncharacterized protein LOC106653308 n=1 Tax=Trichogramma pretiosum TaxID=7493 RepID=UPI0006C9B7E9|nr:uncharacterized protein LOC106653308 [Trichogramma pretiosum]
MRSKRIQDKKEEKKVVKEKTNVKKKAVKEKTKVKKSAGTGIATGRVTRRTVVVAAPRRTIQKRKKYNSSALYGALKTLQDTNLALRRVSDAYGIPLSTLHRKNKNPDDCDKKSGNGPVLGKEVEDEIAKWIKYRTQTGHPVTKNQLLDAIDSYVKIMKLKTPFTEDRPGRSWFSGFRQRYSDLAIRKTQQLNHTRAEVFREDIEGWFAEIQKYLGKKSLTNISADRIFNCDETSVAVCPKGENVITLKGARTVYSICDADKACFTALFMYNAAGTRAPPMVMYNYQDEVPQSILTNSPEGWGTGLSDNSWMTAESFYGYICNVFYPWLLKQNIEFPVIIYADNHASHFNIPLVTFCRERQIELLGLIPNSTHIIQPLDISFFKSFKES